MRFVTPQEMDQLFANNTLADHPDAWPTPPPPYAKKPLLRLWAVELITAQFQAKCLYVVIFLGWNDHKVISVQARLRDDRVLRYFVSVTDVFVPESEAHSQIADCARQLGVRVHEVQTWILQAFEVCLDTITNPMDAPTPSRL